MARFIVRIVDGKPVIFGTAGENTGAPCYVFETKEAYEAAIEEKLIPVGSLLFKLYDAAETAGGPFDSELSDLSDNAVKNKTLKSVVDRLDQSIADAVALRASLTGFGMGKICPVDVTDATEANGLVLGAFEKNAAVSGTLANMVSKAIETGNNKIKFSGGIMIQFGIGTTIDSEPNPIADIKFSDEFSSAPVVAVSPVWTNPNYIITIQTGYARKDGFSAWAFRGSLENIVSNEQFYWIAIGK